MSRPRLLDLFCGAGGAAMGYHRAGFDVVGVDIEPQPLYPFRLVQHDALLALWDYTLWVDCFDAIHASPPCQAFTVYGNNRAHVRDDHPNLIEPTRELLRATGLRRHRLFESNIKLEAVPCAHERFTERRFPGSSNRPNGRTVCNVGEYRVPLAEQREAMQMPWSDLRGISQAVPPVFTEHIGSQLLALLAVA